MHIIKLGAIDSTNSYIKKLAISEHPNNFTAVVAETQTLGRGQVGSVWESEKGKNLTFSVLVSIPECEITDQFYLSMAVALSIFSEVKPYVKNKLFVKWPNDIMAEKNKLAGILIENVLSGQFIKYSVIGIGLNVNQVKFSNDIGNATSLKKMSGHLIDKDALLVDIIKSLKKYVKYVENKEFE